MLTAWNRKELAQTKALLAHLIDNGKSTIVEAMDEVQRQINRIDAPVPAAVPCCPDCGRPGWRRKVAIDFDGAQVIFWACATCRYSRLESML